MQALQRQNGDKKKSKEDTSGTAKE